MKNIRIRLLPVIIALICIIVPAYKAEAKTLEFSLINMEVDVPDHILVLTKDTPSADDQWRTAGILDPEQEKESFDDMGVLAILYDTKTSSLVRLLCKQSAKTWDIFHLSLLSEEELDEFLESLTQTTDQNAVITIEKYPNEETPFFRLVIQTNFQGMDLIEVNYGTIVNGTSISYDIYVENPKEDINEDFIKELISSTRFTEFKDREEVHRLERESFKRAVTRLIIIVISIIALVIFLVISNKRKVKKQKSLSAIKADKLAKFYQEQKHKEENNIKDTQYFINKTVYSEQVIKDFQYYNKFFKNIGMWIVSAIAYLLLIFYFLNTNYLLFILSIIIAIAILYLQGIHIEKLVDKTMKSYSKNNSMEASYVFYDDYYTLSGIQYISKYPYAQIADVREYKEYIYLYMGSDRAVYLKKDGFDGSTEEFLKFIKERTDI
ncbi:MAG: YcxB family protein [Clostridiales bacterium]|nr:YcxB family protein [Clostridiales bacterium]